MRIIVCIKQTGYICHPIAIERKGGEIDPEKIVYMINPCDESAMEEAIRVKEDVPGTEVIALTMGPPRAEEALRYAFAFGADKMIHVIGECTDSLSTAAVLAKVIKGMDYDIILCGKKAIDNNAGMVGSFLAELLGIGHATGIVKLDLFPGEKKSMVERSIGRGDREQIECILPALFTVEKGINDPRYPTLPGRLRSKKEEIERIEMASLDVQQDHEPGLGSISLSPPRPKPKKAFTPDSQLSASERRRLIMSGGGKTAKKGDLIEGTPEETAKIIVDVLVKEKIV